MGKASRESNYLRTFGLIGSPEDLDLLEVGALERICLEGVPLLKTALDKTHPEYKDLGLGERFSESVDSIAFYKSYKQLCKEGLDKLKDLRNKINNKLSAANFNSVLSQIYLSWSTSRRHGCLDSELVYQRIVNHFLPKSYNYLLSSAKLFESAGDIEAAYKNYSSSADLAFRILDGFNRENTFNTHLSKDKLVELAKNVIEPSKKAIELSTRVFDHIFAAEQFRVISNAYGLLSKVLTDQKEFAFKKYNNELSYLEFREENLPMKKADKRYTFQRINFAAKNLTNHDLTTEEEEEVFSNWKKYEYEYQCLLKKDCKLGKIKSDMSRLELERYSLKRKGQKMTTEMHDKYFDFLEIYKSLSVSVKDEDTYDKKMRKQHKQALYKTCLGVIDTLVDEGLFLKNLSFIEYTNNDA